MTVCFVSHSSSLDGAERVLLETVESLHCRGVDCRVVLPSYGPICDELQGLGVGFSVISFPCWMSRDALPFVARLKAAAGCVINAILVSKRIRAWACDIVYSNTVTICVGALAARLVGRPHIWHLHEDIRQQQNGLYFLFGQRPSVALIRMLSSRFICVSKALRTSYECIIRPSKIAVIYPSMHRACTDISRTPLALDAALHTNRPFRCVIVGALIDGKRQDEAIRAVAHLRSHGVEIELVIVGDGDCTYKHYLIDLIRSTDLSRNVTFTGRLRSAINLIASADVLLVCSRIEAFGRVTIEAMLAGTVVIAARAGATVELVQDEITGLLYTPGNCEELACKIEYLYNNPDKWRRIRDTALAWASERFNADRYYRELFQVLTSDV